MDTKRILLFVITAFFLTACKIGFSDSAARESEAVERQQDQYEKAQPIPAFDFSLERDLVVQLYQARNMKAATHSVWRSDYGTIEGDCASIGFGIPYDTSLTNPLVMDRNVNGNIAIEQPEPNGVYASKNTSATWVMCAGSAGTIEPVYVESKVTAYPYSVRVDYDTNRVFKAGKSSVNLRR